MTAARCGVKGCPTVAGRCGFHSTKRRRDDGGKSAVTVAAYGPGHREFERYVTSLPHDVRHRTGAM